MSRKHQSTYLVGADFIQLVTLNYDIIIILLKPKDFLDAFPVVPRPQRIARTRRIAAREFLPRRDVICSRPFPCVDDYVQKCLEPIIKAIDVFDGHFRTVVSGNIEHARALAFDSEDFVGKLGGREVSYDVGCEAGDVCGVGERGFGIALPAGDYNFPGVDRSQPGNVSNKAAIKDAGKW